MRKRRKAALVKIFYVDPATLKNNKEWVDGSREIPKPKNGVPKGA